MTNGNTATLLRLLPSAAPSTSASRIPAPAVPSAKQELDEKIGLAVALATCSIAAAIEVYRQQGAMTPEIRDVSSTRIAKVAELQLDHELGDDDFIRKARESGRRYLRQHFADEFLAVAIWPAGADVAIDIYIDSLLMVVERVVHDERVFRVAWAN